MMKYFFMALFAVALTLGYEFYNRWESLSDGSRVTNEPTKAVVSSELPVSPIKKNSDSTVDSLNVQVTNSEAKVVVVESKTTEEVVVAVDMEKIESSNQTFDGLIVQLDQNLTNKADRAALSAALNNADVYRKEMLQLAKNKP